MLMNPWPHFTPIPLFGIWILGWIPIFTKEFCQSKHVSQLVRRFLRHVPTRQSHPAPRFCQITKNVLAGVWTICSWGPVLVQPVGNYSTNAHVIQCDIYMELLELVFLFTFFMYLMDVPTDISVHFVFLVLRVCIFFLFFKNASKSSINSRLNSNLYIPVYVNQH